MHNNLALKGRVTLLQRRSPCYWFYFRDCSDSEREDNILKFLSFLSLVNLLLLQFRGNSAFSLLSRPSSIYELKLWQHSIVGVYPKQCHCSIHVKIYFHCLTSVIPCSRWPQRWQRVQRPNSPTPTGIIFSRVAVFWDRP